VFSSLTMRQESQTKVLFRERVEQLKVLGLLAALTFKRNLGASLAGSLDVDDMRGRIDIAQRVFAFHLDSSGH
jgi:hypothetical protein